MNDAEKLLVRIHFASGKTVETEIEADEDSDADVEAESVVEALVLGPVDQARGKPRWTWVGDVFLYTQTIEGIEIL